MNKNDFWNPKKRIKMLVDSIESHDAKKFLSLAYNDLESGVHGTEADSEYQEMKRFYEKMVKDEGLAYLTMAKTVLSQPHLFTIETVQWANDIYIKWREASIKKYIKIAKKKGNNKA